MVGALAHAAAEPLFEALAAGGPVQLGTDVVSGVHHAGGDGDNAEGATFAHKPGFGGLLVDLHRLVEAFADAVEHFALALVPRGAQASRRRLRGALRVTPSSSESLVIVGRQGQKLSALDQHHLPAQLAVLDLV